MNQVANISPRAFFFLLLGFAVTLEVIADVLLKKWSIDGRWPVLAIGLLVYFLGTVSWAYSLKYELLSKAILLFTLTNLIVVTIIGLLFFKEELSLSNKIGILLGLVN